MFEELTHRIDQLLDKPPIVVAISGFGGAGKTTLTEKLIARYGDATKLQLDNFIVNRGEGEGWLGGYDWERFRSVLEDAEAGRPLRYQWYDWNADALAPGPVDEPARPLVIVEGVRLLQLTLMDLFTLTVWIDRSAEEATAQGIARDRINKDHWSDAELEAHIQKWHDVWVPKDQEFAEACHPRELADVLYREA